MIDLQRHDFNITHRCVAQILTCGEVSTHDRRHGIGAAHASEATVAGEIKAHKGTAAQPPAPFPACLPYGPPTEQIHNELSRTDTPWGMVDSDSEGMHFGQLIVDIEDHLVAIAGLSVEEAPQ